MLQRWLQTWVSHQSDCRTWRGCGCGAGSHRPPHPLHPSSEEQPRAPVKHLLIAQGGVTIPGRALGTLKPFWHFLQLFGFIGVSSVNHPFGSSWQQSQPASAMVLKALPCDSMQGQHARDESIREGLAKSNVFHRLKWKFYFNFDPL